jgi:hypothetical protein
MYDVSCVFKGRCHPITLTVEKPEGMRCADARTLRKTVVIANANGDDDDLAPQPEGTCLQKFRILSWSFPTNVRTERPNNVVIYDTHKFKRPRAMSSGQLPSNESL